MGYMKACLIKIDRLYKIIAVKTSYISKLNYLFLFVDFLLLLYGLAVVFYLLHKNPIY